MCSAQAMRCGPKPSPSRAPQMTCSSSRYVRRGWLCGAELRFSSAAAPASRSRRTHFATVCRETWNWRATSACGQPAETSRTSHRRVFGVRRALR